jgi:hypothetical protein
VSISTSIRGDSPQPRWSIGPIGLLGNDAVYGVLTSKLLQIIDETGTTGIQGYYLRIPESATAAFGDIGSPRPLIFLISNSVHPARAYQSAGLNT